MKDKEKLNNSMKGLQIHGAMYLMFFTQCKYSFFLLQKK